MTPKLNRSNDASAWLRAGWTVQIQGWVGVVGAAAAMARAPALALAGVAMKLASRSMLAPPCRSNFSARLARWAKSVAPPAIGGMLLACLVFLSQTVRADAKNLGGFDFCPRPVKPACVGELSEKSSQTAFIACKAEVDRYVKMTFTFRRCLNRQLQSEIREVNRVLDRFRCLNGKVSDKRLCSQFDREP